MHYFAFEEISSFIFGHPCPSLIAMTEYYLVKLFNTALTVDEHFEPPFRIIFISRCPLDARAEHDIFEQVEMLCISFNVLLKFCR